MNKYIIFGTGQRAERLMNQLLKKGALPSYFADNAAKKWGMKFWDIPVLNPVEMYEKIKNSQMKVCIACKYREPIFEQLKAMGINESNILSESELMCLITGEDIVLFGAGMHGNRILSYMRNHGREVNFFVDNDISKWNKNENGITVCNPSILLKKKHLRVCTTGINQSDMRAQLLTMGIAEQRILSEEDLIDQVNGQCIILFGAGSRGKKFCDFLYDNNLVPSYFADNAPEKIGTYFNGVFVLAPKDLYKKKNKKILITTIYEDEIRNQLIKLGVLEQEIISCSSIVPYILRNCKDEYEEALGKSLKRNKAWGVIFDCQNGLGLGGIENWTFSVGTQLVRENIDVTILSGGDPSEHAPGILKDMVEYIPVRQQYAWKRETLLELARGIIRHLPCNLVTCHVDDVMMAGYIVKLIYPDDIRIIATIHGGNDAIYKEYAAVADCVDLLVGVSVDIREGVRKLGVSASKILNMTCPVICPDKLERTYSKKDEPIKIAYAGRLIIAQKRTDLLPPLIEELERRKVNYQLDIAGEGPYCCELQDFIKQNELQNKVRLLGRLNEQDMKEYWKHRDVFINLSEFEGNSLSLMESMANGLVPVVTEVSGVKENVRQDYNGYYVNLGDIKAIANKIDYLDHNRDILNLFGSRGHQIIKPKSQMDKHIVFWKKIMKYVPPKVSIVVPIYNAEQYLEQCLQSLLTQTLNDIEIICINDGSTDHTNEILNQYKQYDNRIKVINKRNTGYGNSMNIGIAAARGDFIGILESDDFAKEDMFEKLYIAAVKNGAEVVKSNFIAYQRNWEVPEEFLEILSECPYNQIVNPMVTQEIFYVQASIWSAIYKREFLLDNHIFFNETPGASFQDTAFAFKVWATATRAYFVPEAYVYYRMNNAEASSLSKSKVFCICDEFEAIEQFLEEKPTKKELLQNPLMITKFRIYMWNYNRIRAGYQYAFMAKMHEEFINKKYCDMLHESAWEKKDWEDLQLLLYDMNELFEKTKK